MITKQKIELEILFKTSPKVFENLISTPSGLSEWFADDVNIKDKVYTFYWDGSEESAKLLISKPGSLMRWKWEHDEDEESYFEIRYEINSMTKDLVIHITDFAEEDDVDEITQLWQKQIDKLKRILGA